MELDRKTLDKPQLLWYLYYYMTLKQKRKKNDPTKKNNTYMFHVLGNNMCFLHSGKRHEIVFIGLHKFGGISLFFKLAIYCQNEKLKNENLKKVILEIFNC